MIRRGPLKVLCVVYGGGHVNMVVPVVEVLRRQGVETVVLGLTTARQVLDRRRIPSLGFRDFFDPHDPIAAEHGRRLAADLPPGAGVDLQESQAYLGACYAELEQDLGSLGAQSAFAARGRQAFLPVRFMKQVLHAVQPDVLLTTNSPRSEHAAVLAARGMGVPAVCLKDSLGQADLPRLADPDYADQICVLSESVRRRLIDLGRPADDVQVTGNPDFDRLARPELADESRTLRTSLGLPADFHPEAKLLAWGSNSWPVWPELPRLIEQRLIDAVSRRPNWRLRLRRHPNEAEAAGPLPANVSISRREEDPAALFLAADGLATIMSTVGLQARLMGTPVVSIAPGPDFPDRDWLARERLASWVDDLSDVDSAVAQMLDQPRSRPQGFPALGRAAQAAAEVVLQTAELRRVSTIGVRSTGG